MQILLNKGSIKYMYECIFDTSNAKKNHERNSKGENTTGVFSNFALVTSPSIWIEQVIKTWHTYPAQIIVGQTGIKGLLSISVFTAKQ